MGRMLRRYAEAKGEKLVFFGCVLRPDFDWGAVRDQFQVVRNELGAKDWVSLISGLLAPFIHEMGPGGRRGFRRPPEYVLTLSQQMGGGPWRQCDCAVCVGKANFPVLNIKGLHPAYRSDGRHPSRPQALAPIFLGHSTRSVREFCQPLRNLRSHGGRGQPGSLR